MTTIKAFIGRNIAQLITSTRIQSWRRSAHAIRRKAQGRQATVHYFHQPDDPYSQLLARALSTLQAKYNIAIVSHIVPTPDAAAAPDLARLRVWAQRDAERLGSALLKPPRFGADPAQSEIVSSDELLEGAVLRKRLGHYLGATLYFELRQ